MRMICRAAAAGLLAMCLGPLGALAESQSSNSSSNCSNGRCSRVESLMVEDRNGRRGWVRTERWREGGGRNRVEQRRYRDDRAYRPNRRGGSDDRDDD